MPKSIDRFIPIHPQLINWYKENKRNLPWRKTTDPYLIWLSEIILQQTRVAQGMAYYQKFSQHYPTVFDLANATEDEVMKDWQGLGYYSRARNLHAAAKSIVNDHGGSFPKEYQAIRALKGVGHYTAAAVASFAFDLPYPVLDGNVYRFLSRLYGIDIPINTPAAQKEFLELAEKLMPNQQAAEFNQAIMEFGALQCVPKNPKCSNCPFQSRCFAYSENKVDFFPVKKKAAKQKHRYFNYFVLQAESEVLITQRTQKDIWHKLYEFPLIESKKKQNFESLLSLSDIHDKLKGQNFVLESQSEDYKHILSHQIIHARFYQLKVEDLNSLGFTECEIVNLSEFEKYPIPKLLENYLRQETNFLSLPS
ncbi:MAG: A/G-specific adenine glycosylase [Vicingaceae bacterium]